MGLKYTKAKIFHFKDKIDSLPESVDDILSPVHIRIKPANICNHDCFYCAYRVNGLDVGKDMSTRDLIPREKMMEIIDDIIEMGVSAVTFSGGGEPFLYPYLVDAVKKLADSPVCFAALTNGSRLQGEAAELFAHRGTWVRISMDGYDDETYSFYRGVARGEFSRVMRNLENFKKFGGKCHLGISLIVDKHNASHIYNFTRKIRAAGADSIKISPCIVSTRAVENNEYHKPFFEIARDEISRIISDFSDKRFEIFDAYHELKERFDKNYAWCPNIQMLPIIGADQNVYCCQDKAYDLKKGLLGSIHKQRFKDFWMSNKSKFFHIDPSRQCSHHCVASAKNKLVLEYLEADFDHVGFV